MAVRACTSGSGRSLGRVVGIVRLGFGFDFQTCPNAFNTDRSSNAIGVDDQGIDTIDLSLHNLLDSVSYGLRGMVFELRKCIADKVTHGHEGSSTGLQEWELVEDVHLYSVGKYE